MKQLVSEINRMREIMKLKPLLVEAIINPSALRTFFTNLVQVFENTKNLSLPNYGVTVTLPNGKTLAKETFEKTRKWLTDIEAGIADINMSRTYQINDLDAVKLVNLIEESSPGSISTVQRELLDEIKTDLNAQGFDISGEEAIVFWVDDMIKNSPTPTTAKKVISSVTKDPILDEIFAQFYKNNRESILKGTYLGPVRKPKLRQKYYDDKFFLGLYQTAMRIFEPAFFQKWKQRWLISIGLENYDGPTLFRHKGEFFMSHKELIETIEKRLDLINTKLAKGEKAINIQDDLGKIVNSINNMKTTGADSLKKYYLKYILENENLPPDVIQTFKESPQWKAIEQFIEMSTEGMVGRAVWKKITAYPKMIPVLGTLIEKYSSNVNWSQARSISIQRWQNFLNSANPLTIAEARAISAQSGALGDQISALIDLALIKSLAIPLVYGTFVALVRNRQTRLEMNEDIKNLKEFCFSIKKQDPTYKCEAIDNLKEIGLGEDAWSQIISDSDIYQYGSGNISIKDIKGMQRWTDAIDFIKEVAKWEFEGEGAIVEGKNKVDEWVNKYESDFCKTLKEQLKKDCSEFKNAREMLTYLSAELAKKQKELDSEKIKKELEREKFVKDSTGRSNKQTVAANPLGFAAFIELYNSKVSDDQDLQALYFCKAEGVGYSKHKTNGTQACWYFNPNKDTWETCPSEWNASNVTTYCEDFQNNIYKY